ncbi:MAG: dockerin type I repeat-containing protein [Oscillospiraceae bacterium]|nr:dockerin type I repeat-containing protein [Oscillospiraceae bacterium]
MKRLKSLLSVILTFALIFTLSVAAHAAGNVVYSNGVEGSNWPYKNAYLASVTIEGVTIKNYEWTDSNNCNVVLTSDTAADATVTFNAVKGGSSAFFSKMVFKLNGTAFTSTANVQLVDGALSNVSLYVDGVFKTGTKYFHFTTAEENNLPTLADKENNTTSATVVGTEGYSINVAQLFTDADAADTLTYNVAVNGGESTPITVDENGVYTHPTKLAGEYTLVFTATDSKEDTSTDTYTVNLTVENSAVTYDATVSVPAGVTPQFFINAGFGADGKFISSTELSATAGEEADGMVPYTVSIPENVTEINVTDGTKGMSVTTGEGAQVTMRNVNVTAQDMFGKDVTATVSTAYGDGHVATGADNAFLLVAGVDYTFTSTPSNTTVYKTATNTQTLEAGTTAAVLNALVDYNNLRTIITPTGATAQLFRYEQYYSNTEFTNYGTKDNGNGTSTHYFAGVTTKPPAAALIYRVTYGDYIVKAGWMSTETSKTVTYSENDLKNNATVDYTTSTEASAAIAEDSVMLNVNKHNNLTMNVGASTTLKAYRAWEIIPVSYNNWIIEPDFHFNVIYESEEGVVSLKTKSNNMTGGESWQTLTANKAGTAIIEVTYDAIDVRGNSYAGVYGASDPARTGLVVVQVGQTHATVDFGIDGKASQGNVSYEKSTPKSWDAEFDTLYFTGENGTINFTPTVTGGTVEKVEVSNDKGTSWTELSATEGVYTATIASGNNIIKVTADTGVAYQVVRGDKVTYTVEEVAAAATNINDNDGVIEAGETVRVTVDGLHSPIPKMAGNYNPGYGGNTDGYSSHHIRYTLNGTEYAGAGSQYNWMRSTNYIDITLADQAGQQTIEDGYIGVGVIGLEFFADDGDSHRNIPDAGCATRGSQTTFNTRSVLPDITIDVAENTKYTVTLTEGDGYTLAPVDGFETSVYAGKNFQFTLTVNEGYITGEDFAVTVGETVLTAVDGVYTIENITEDVTITVTGVEKEITFTLGDVNADGAINSTDATLVLRYASSLISEIDTNAADVNADGTINSTDASLILRYAAGNITEFPTAG